MRPKTPLPFHFQAYEELPGGHCSHVYANADLVLKVPFQGEELDSGFRASLALASTVGPTILDGDPTTGAILMRRIRPGIKLSEAGLDDDAMNAVFHQMVKSVAGIPNDNYLPLELYHEAQNDLLESLTRTAPERQFLHGDLHHENILRDDASPTGWTLIDPKGLWGEACFEAVAWLRNPYRTFTSVAETMLRTKQQLAWLEDAFGWDADRILAYASLDVTTLSVDLWGPYIVAVRNLVQERGIHPACFLR